MVVAHLGCVDRLLPIANYDEEYHARLLPGIPLYCIVHTSKILTKAGADVMIRCGLCVFL